MDESTPREMVTHIFRRPGGQVRLGVLTAWLLALAVLTLIGTVYLAQASQAAEEGAELETLTYRLSELQRANAQLEADIALAQNPDRLARRAAELGYRPATIDELEFVRVQNYPMPARAGSASGAGEPPLAAETDPLSALWAQLVLVLGGGP